MLWLVPLLGACAPVPPQPVGADADEHGCRASAGYAWCARLARCERPWELAAREGIDRGAPQVAAWRLPGPR